jgi:hypothetical protein
MGSPGLKALNSYVAAFPRALNRVRNKLVSEQILDAAAEDSAEKFGTGQLPQGLKPDVYWIVYGPTKVVP